MFDDPHLKASGGLEPVTLTDGTQTALPALPITMGGRRPGAPSALPEAGADTRAVLAALGYGLIGRLRALALKGTAIAHAQVDTLRIKLLKVAAVITRNTRRIRLYLDSHWPSADIFTHAVNQLRSP